MSIRRLFLAVVISSAAIIPFYLVVIILSGEINNMLLLLALIVALVVSMIGVVCVGLPTHFILRRLGKAYSFNYAIVGFAIPAIATAIVHPFGEDGVQTIAMQSFFLGFFGALIALVFWKVVACESDTQKIK